jgi:hypothetical protein
VAHACNPSFSGGRDLEDRNSAWGNSSRELSQKKKKSQKWACGMAPVQTLEPQKKKRGGGPG